MKPTTITPATLDKLAALRDDELLMLAVKQMEVIIRLTRKLRKVKP